MGGRRTDGEIDEVGQVDYLRQRSPHLHASAVSHG